MNHLTIEVIDGNNEPVVERVYFPAVYADFEQRHLFALANYLDRMGKVETAYVELVRDIIGLTPAQVLLVDPEVLFAFDYDEDGEMVYLPELQFLAEPYSNERSLLQSYKDWEGPGDRLSNFSIERVGFADGFINQFSEDPSNTNLALVWAALYKWKEKPWAPSQIDELAKAAAAVPRHIKLAAVLNYRGIIAAMAARFPRVYSGGTPDGTEIFGWEGTIQKLAKTQVFGSYQEAKEAGFEQAMILFEMNGIEVERIKRESEKNKLKPK